MLAVKCLRIMRASARNAGTEKFNAALSLLNSIALFLVLFSIYSTAYSGVSGAGSIGLNTTMWSLGVYSLFWATGVRNLYSDVHTEVQSGAIETRMTLPINYPLLKVCERIGRGAWTGLLQFAMLVSLFALLVGRPEVSNLIARIAYFWPMFLVGVVIASCLFVMLGISSIWLYDSKPLFWLVDKTGMILGGAFVPLALMPIFIQDIAQWLPPGAMMNSARIFGDHFLDQANQLLSIQLIVAAGCLLLLGLVWRQAQRKININGG